MIFQPTDLFRLFVNLYFISLLKGSIDYSDKRVTYAVSHFCHWKNIEFTGFLVTSDFFVGHLMDKRGYDLTVIF